MVLFPSPTHELPKSMAQTNNSNANCTTGPGNDVALVHTELPHRVTLIMYSLSSNVAALPTRRISLLVVPSVVLTTLPHPPALDAPNSCLARRTIPSKIYSREGSSSKLPCRRVRLIRLPSSIYGFMAITLSLILATLCHINKVRINFPRHHHFFDESASL